MPGPANTIGQRGFPVRQRAGLVEDDRAAAVDALQHRRIANDDAALRRERDGADDGHRNADEQRTRRRHDEHGQESHRLAAPHPGRNGERERDWRVPRTQLITESAELRTPLLRVTHDVHDAGVARINRQPARPQRQRVLAVDGAGEHLGSGAFGIMNGSPVRYDSSMTPRPSITTASTGQISCGYTISSSPMRTSSSGTSTTWPIGATMCDERHSTCERLQHRGRASEREGLEGFSARQHQHDKRAGEVLLQQHRGDDGDAGQQIGAELAPNGLEREGQHERHTAGGEHDVQRQLACGWRRIAAPAQCQMRDDTSYRKSSDDRCAPASTWPPPPAWRGTGALPHCDGWTRHVHDRRPGAGTFSLSLVPFTFWVPLPRSIRADPHPDNQSRDRPDSGLSTPRGPAGSVFHRHHGTVSRWRGERLAA